MTTVAGAFPWPEREEETPADLSPLGELPESGPIAEFRRSAEVLSVPADPSRPWVLASGNRVVKAYDLRAFDTLDRLRARAEAETAIAVSNIPGVVTAYRSGEIGDWLVIEMERLGGSVAEHLAEVASGKRAPLEPATWARLFEEAAVALDALHKRHVIHRDVKPANLLFDRGGERLLLADFSIASKLRRRGGNRPRGDGQDLAGTRRYIAPEVLQGRMGQAVDQYGLAVTATEALGDRATPAARQVLVRASDQAPEERFPTVTAFAVALRSALEDTGTHRASLRLERVSPKWRQGWGAGAAAFAFVYAVLVAIRPDGLNWAGGVLIPGLGAGATIVLIRWLNFLRGKRTQPRFRYADRPWFPVVLFVAAVIGARPLIVHEPRSAAKILFYCWVGSLVLTSLLGSVRRNPGERLIVLVQRWERRREAARRTPLGWRGPEVALAAGVLLLIAIPAALSAVIPGSFSNQTARDYPALVLVSQFRAASLAGELSRACGLMRRVPESGDWLRCEEWSPLAAGWLRDDVAAHGAPALTDDELDGTDVSFASESETYGAPSWEVWRPAGGHEDVGVLSREDQSGHVWTVSLTRAQPADDPLAFQRSFWEYEIANRAGHWEITSIETCSTENGQCVHISQVTRAELRRMERRTDPSA
jgi:hypothetical protein